MIFEIGDVARLNSGGLDMTVDYAGEKKFTHGGKVEVVVCVWFDGKTLKKETFKPEQLEMVKKK